jgi:hypothetical protein
MNRFSEVSADTMRVLTPMLEDAVFVDEVGQRGACARAILAPRARPRPPVRRQ